MRFAIQDFIIVLAIALGMAIIANFLGNFGLSSPNLNYAVVNFSLFLPFGFYVIATWLIGMRILFAALPATGLQMFGLSSAMMLTEAEKAIAALVLAGSSYLALRMLRLAKLAAFAFEPESAEWRGLLRAGVLAAVINAFTLSVGLQATPAGMNLTLHVFLMIVAQIVSLLLSLAVLRLVLKRI